MIYHTKDFPVEAVQVTSQMLTDASVWPAFTEQRIVLTSTVGGSSYARLLDGTPINENDYVVNVVNDEGLTVTVTVMRQAAFEARYQTA